MSAAQVLRSLRRSAAPCFLGVAIIAFPAMAVVDRAESGGQPRVVLAQSGGTAVSPYQEPAPTLFEATGSAVWDGKRTLQGVWVAHPLATSARRVRIYNTDTGAAVDGALFKRDPALTGPAVLVSSEAAQFLGMSPGDETNLRIVALTPTQRPGNDGTATTGASAGTGATATGAAPAEPPRTEATGAASAPAAASPTTAPAPTRPAEARATAPAAAPRAAAAPAAALPAAAPPAAAAPAADLPAADPPAADVPAADIAAADIPAAGGMAAASADASGVATLVEPAPEASAPSPSRPVFQAAPDTAPRDTAAAVTVVAPAQPPAVVAVAPDPAAAAPATGPAPPTPGARPEPSRTASLAPLAQPYVQAGIFGVSENAERLIGRLRAASLPALGKPIELNGKAMTRVLAGPFTAAAERDAALRAIRGMGLKDAAPVAR